MSTKIGSGGNNLLDGGFGYALADFEAGVADEDAAHRLGDGAVDGEAGDDVFAARARRWG